jgi:Fe-S-cluster containining protein
MNIRVNFTVNGRSIHVEAAVPEGPARLDELLPALRAIDDRMIGITVARQDAAGQPISCRKGCSACCRMQPVPITAPEAFAVARLVDALPEPRRGAVRTAFTAAVARVRAAGLYDLLMRRDSLNTREAALATARRYMALALPCPFLVNDSCSIYAERPFVCRQYLVTSPPKFCDAPLDNPVKPVKTPARFATALLNAAQALTGRTQYTVPLVLALECAEANKKNLTLTHDGKTAFSTVMGYLRESA